MVQAATYGSTGGGPDMRQFAGDYDKNGREWV